LEWARKIDGELATGEQFFKSRSTLYDAMPAIWKTMPVEDRLSVIERIDKYYNDSLYDDVDPWNKSNVLDLMEIVPLADIDRIRACYLVAKRDPGVITRTETEVQDAAASFSTHAVFECARLYPTDLVASYSTGKAEFVPTRVGITDKWTRWLPEEDNWKPLLQHLHYRAGRKHIIRSIKSGVRSDFVPADYLNCIVRDDQKTVLNDSLETDKALYVAEDEAFGDGAKQKRARRRLDIMDGNIKSHARWLNNPERLEANIQLLRLQAVIQDIRVDAEDKKKAISDKRKKKNVKKLQKIADQEEVERLKAEELFPELEHHVLQGFDHIQTLTVSNMKDILIYYFYELKTEV
jgi:hypothetical protein